MKPGNFVLAGAIFCLLGMVTASGDSGKKMDLSAVQWVTQNPPAGEELNSCVRVVEFWATWCWPCRIQISHFKSLAKKYEDRNVIFIGLSKDRSADTVSEFVTKKEINYHVGMDSGIGDSWGVQSIPTAFVISHEGKFLWCGNPRDAKCEAVIKQAVAAAPKPLLEGVDLGRYSYLRIKLCGGAQFVEAYTALEGHAKNCGCTEKLCACKVLASVNTKLREKITAAQMIRHTDPKTALTRYKDIVDKFGGISLTRESELIYAQLQQELGGQIPAVAKAE
ncbi:MAG TPA: TlpA disulfide reductase family protein [Anaerohalosphaeraceae bacterium]|nr:TlpA disulfide reductase family protein [Anaerohalosphaeraceae bacterium]